MKRSTVCVWTVMLALLSVAAHGATQGEGQKPGKQFRLHPAAEPVPALKHRLIVPRHMRKPGNAAPLYLRAALLATEVRAEDASDQVKRFLEVPISELDAGTAAHWAGLFREATRVVELGASRRSCQWELPLEQGPAMLMGELSRCREVAYAIALQARGKMLRGDYREALDSVRTGLTLANDLGQSETLLSGLVGKAVADVMFDRLEEFVQRPGTPNLYWALAALPDPPVSLSRAMEEELELTIFRHSYPGLVDPEGTYLTPAEWRELVAQTIVTFPGGAGRTERRFGPTWFGLYTYPDAREYLVETKGYSAGEVERMPVLKACMIYVMDGFERLAHDELKWAYVAYPEGARRLRKHEAEAMQEAVRRKNGWFAAMIMPAGRLACRESAESQRRVAALRCVEALRMYAAAHDGTLPESPEDVEVVPFPLDPVAGEPFEYRREGHRALLSAPWDPGGLGLDGVRYEITIVREQD